uniref:Homeobox domain-containing protein n=1 Tax=Kalanchoe fedtschenkoi TaxID=63787 RepID=A0A7N1A0I9_KALFE
MASSNRHWPSMFKSKPCNPHHQWQHDLNSSLLSGCHRNPYTSGVEERSPEPKPRWNPKPEQIRILEAIFNSGMVNPPRDEIRKIRAQLQEYGQVGDANVFYWFQNRKSRSKHKNRQPPKSQQNQSNPSATARAPHQSIPTTTPATAAPSLMTNPSSSSSSSSDKSPPKLNPNKTTNSPTCFSLGSSSSNLLDQLAYNSPTTSVNQNYDHFVQHDQPFMFPLQHLNFTSQGFTGFPDQHTPHQQMMMTDSNNLINNNISHSVGPCTEFLFSELISSQHGVGISDPKKDAEDEEKLMMMKLGYATAPSATSPTNNVPASAATVLPLPSTLNQLQDESGGSAVVGPMKSTVFINDVAFEVNCGPFHVREAFGNDAVLLHSTGQPVLTNEWGVTLQPLQHGAFYYLI